MENKNIIEKINELEEKIFLKFKTKFLNLNIEKRLSKQFSQNYIKIANCKHKNLNTMNSLKILVKISGIWKSLNTKQVGLTFKFFFLLNKIIDIQPSTFNIFKIIYIWLIQNKLYT